MPETPIALLISPDLPPLPRGHPLPTAPLAPPAPADADREPIVLGVAAVDGSGRVRERAVLAALGWGCGNLLDIHLAGNIGLLHTAPHGHLHVDARDQIPLPGGCRAMLGITPGDRVVLAALPARKIAVVCPMPIATAWANAFIANLPRDFDA